MQCPSCAAPLTEGSRFCSSCGSAVAAPAAEERRIVTVLFGDIVGYTTLAEHRDPETVKRLIDGAFALLVDDITSFGGRVDKVLGDGILALFGAPVAHEDDAERAVRAALRMQQTLAHYVADAAADVPLRMRIGINTGEVLVGTLAGSDYTAMGDVVNTASRLQAQAPPGGVLVGEATYALTSAAIEYSEPATLQPRGREQSVTTWVALDTITAPGERARRTDLAMVGREAEMTLGLAALSLAVRQRRSLLMNIVGDSGVGKSRLVDELLASLDDVGATDALVLSGVCAPYGATNVWAPIAGALTDYLGIDTSLPIADVRAQVVHRAEAFVRKADNAPDPERVADVLMHLVGLDSPLDALEPSAQRATVQRLLTRVIELRAATAPLVLWVDDLHWADQTMLDLLEHLVVSANRLPFILITTMRPGTDLHWPPANERTTEVIIPIEPLNQAESEQLAMQLLDEQFDQRDVERPIADQRLIGALYQRSGGNPLFLQELAAVVAEEGPASELPDSLRAVIAARLDQLSVPERQVLDNAAVLGLSGSVVGLERFATAMNQNFARSTLHELDLKGLLQMESAHWRFRSDSVREAVYQTLTKAARAQRHAGVAASFRVTAHGTPDDLAHHTATAAELVAEVGAAPGVPTDIRHQALEALSVAAARATETGNHRQVIRHASRALALLDLGEYQADSDDTALRLLRCSAMIELRDYVHARTDVDVLLAHAAAAHDVAVEGEARRLLGTIHHLTGHQAEARDELGRSVDLLRGTEHHSLLAAALRQRGFIELFGGSAQDAEWFFGEAESAYRTLGDERGLAYIEQYRAWLSFLSGDLALADERLHRAAEALERLGDRNGVGWAFGLLAFVRFYQGRFGEAEDLAVVVRGEALERGDEWAAAMMQTLMADLRLWQGHLDEALHNAEHARNRFRRVGDKFGIAQSVSALVRAQVALGRTVAAQRSMEELASLADNSPAGPVPQLAIAGAAMHRGDGAIARDAALALTGERTTNPVAVGEANLVLAVAELKCGSLDAAVAALESVGGQLRQHPFAHAVAALVRAAAGDSAIALAEVAAVPNSSGATYLDRAFSAVAAAAAHRATDDRAAAEAAIGEALVECLEVGDVVAIALLQIAATEIVGVPHGSGASTTGTLGDGWTRLIALLAATAA